MEMAHAKSPPAMLEFVAEQEEVRLYQVVRDRCLMGRGVSGSSQEGVGRDSRGADNESTM